MSGILKMPRMGETMEEGKLLAWLVEPGQPFKRGDPILEVETDKTVVEFPALGDGTLVETLIELGEMVDVGTPIAKIDCGDGLDWIGGDDEPEPEEGEAVEGEADLMVASACLSVLSVVRLSTDTRIRATPLARRAAHQANINIVGVVGTGRRGRVEYCDVVAASQPPAPVGLKLKHGIAWKEQGSETNKPIIFLHGFAADHSAWSGLQSQLARDGHYTLAVDLPAHGAATQEAYDTEDLSSSLVKMAKEQFGEIPIHIVAHSMGAIPAVALAKIRPTASITLISPAGVGRTIDTDFLNELSNPRSALTIAQVLGRMTNGPNGLSDAAYKAMFEILQKGRLKDLMRSLAGPSGQVVDIRNDIAALAKDIPVSMILGHRDRIMSWSEALDISSLVAVHHFVDAGHMPHWEKLPDVILLIKNMIK
ncbi:MAG: pimeloyl-ACP methyl ester carboxylesterase [Octadecabacter sp.]|jgi:pimeloyl-ACP methyl ester carboxylesterase